MTNPTSERRAPRGARQQPATESVGTYKVAGIAEAGAALGAAGPGPHSLPTQQPLRPLAATIARIAQFGPLELSPALPPARTLTPVTVSAPVAPPTVEPHTPPVAPPTSDVPAVAQWTPADVTEHPEFSAAPATESGGPSKMRGRRKFVSKKQWEWAFATHKPWAKKWARRTPGPPKVRFRVLPTRKAPPGAGSIR